MINRRFRLTTLVHDNLVERERTHTLIVKSRGYSSRCWGLAFGLALHIGITSLRLSPLDRFVQEK